MDGRARVRDGPAAGVRPGIEVCKIRAVARNDVIIDPTLVFFDAMVRGDDPAVIESPRLELLVAAGIPAEDVLVIATANGAKAAGQFDDRGTIEAGKRADLVLLARDPHEDIRATRDLLWVMRRGRIFDPDVLLDDPSGATSSGSPRVDRSERSDDVIRPFDRLPTREGRP